MSNLDRDRPKATPRSLAEWVSFSIALLVYVPFEVTNTGGGTVESVEVIAQLTINGQIVETGQTQIDFLSSGEVSSGAFIFNHNPAQGNLSIRVASYKLP